MLLLNNYIRPEKKTERKKTKLTFFFLDETDRVLKGLIEILTVILRKQPSLKKNSGILLGELFNNCLFGIPSISEDFKRTIPKCKQNGTREAAFKLLAEISKEYTKKKKEEEEEEGGKKQRKKQKRKKKSKAGDKIRKKQDRKKKRGKKKRKGRKKKKRGKKSSVLSFLFL